MNIINTTFINNKKLKERTGKAMFLILPITILVTLSIIISSQTLNFKNAVDESVFGTIDEQARLIELSKPEIVYTPGMPRSEMSADTQLTEADLSVIKSIDNVQNAVLNSSIPISNLQTNDLFNDTTIQLQSLTGLDSQTAALYTEEKFEYIENEPIPIILNASSFITKYQDWNGKTEFTLNFREMRDRGADITTLTPVKTKAINYEKSDLIGNEFTIQIGGLDEIANFTNQRESGVITMKLLSDEEIQTLKQERTDTLSLYWDVQKLNTPITKTFRVVGIIEDTTNTATYVPNEFNSIIMNEYISVQQNARTATDIPVNLLDDTFTGLTYDGYDLVNGNSANRPGTGGMGQFFGPNTQTESYKIPGLVIELSDDSSDTVKGIYTNTSVYEESIKYGDSISILVDSVYNREQVINDLNDLGYAYQDINNLSVFDTLQNTLTNITVTMTISFIVLITAVIILTMSKFVADSRKEIGIFRAIGVTQKGIVKLFVSQALLYSFVGYFFGVIFGYLLNLLSAGFMKSWFDRLIGGTLEESYGVIVKADPTIFTGIDVHSIVIFTVLLFLVTLFISLIPALKASSISPVEAIKGE